MGICIKHLFSLERNRTSVTTNAANGLKRSLLQLPTSRDPKLVKSSPGRGSWPGPSATGSSACCPPKSLLASELSKSEQQLPCSGPYPRKGSNSSNCSSASEPYRSSFSASGLSPARASSQYSLLPSKSEDTLFLGPSGGGGTRQVVLHHHHQHHQQHQRVRASASTSPPPSRGEGVQHLLAGEEQGLKMRMGKSGKPAASVAALTEKDDAPGILQVMDFDNGGWDFGS